MVKPALLMGKGILLFQANPDTVRNYRTVRQEVEESQRIMKGINCEATVAKNALVQKGDRYRNP